MACDICNKAVKGTLVSADDMRRAAANGFNPFALGLIPPVWQALGVSQERAYHNWRYNQVAKDETDWDVCDACMDHLKKYLQAPESPPLQVPPPDHILILVGGDPPEGREAHGQKVFQDISPVQGNFPLTIQSVDPAKAQQSNFIILSIVRLANSRGFDVDIEKARVFGYTLGGLKGTMIFIYKQLQAGKPSTRVFPPDLVYILVGGNPPEGREAFGQKVFGEISPILGNFPLVIQSVNPAQAQDEKFILTSAVLMGRKQGFDIDIEKTLGYNYELGGLQGTMLFMYKQGQ